jgi:hypothetical protein
MSSRLLVTVSLLSAFVFTRPAHAQQLPPWLMVRASVLAELDPSPAPSAAAARERAIAHSLSAQHQQRARRITATGLGVLLGAGITASYALPLRSQCYGSEPKSSRELLPLILGTGAIGLVAAGAGGTWLGLEARRHGLRSSRRQRLMAAGIGALTATLTQAVHAPLVAIASMCSD